MTVGKHRKKTSDQKDTAHPGWLGLLVILALTAAIFWPALRFGFVFDDRVQIAANPSIYSWSHVPDYFRGQIWGFAHVWTSYYRPLFLLTLRVWHSFVSLDTAGWHALPILVHLLNVTLAYLLARKLSGDLVTALTATALFAVHPVQLESVACLYGVTDPLTAGLLLGAFLCFLKFQGERNSAWLAGTAVLFAAGLLMKESAIVFPLVLAAYDSLLPTQDKAGKKHRSIALLLAMVGLAAVYLLVRRAALGMTFGTVAANVPWGTVIYTAPSTLLLFLRLLLFPYGMSSFYDSPYVNDPGMKFAISLLILLLIAIGIWLWSRRATKLISFCAIWALLAVLPVLNIRFMQEGDFVHIRFLYISSFAFSLLIALGLREVVPRTRLRNAVAAGLLVLLAASTRMQIGYFANNEALYKRGIELAPDNRVPKNNLADDYIKQGRDDEARPLLEDLLKRHPDFWMANYNMGYLAYKHGEWPKVVEYMGRSIAQRGEEVDAHVYRGYALMKLGSTEEAEKEVREAISQRPNSRSYHFVLGLVLRQEQRWPEALEAFQRELEVNPKDSGALQHVADLRARLKQAHAPANQ